MFNGLIEAVGRIDELTTIPAGIRVRILTPFARELSLGESVAVNGVCLTVTERGDRAFEADISPETLRVTSLGALQPEVVVNLERSMRADARVGGHFVQGHVDGTGCIDALRHDEDFHRVGVSFSPDWAAHLVHKGSVAVDGISLTVARLEPARFEVQIVPFTWEHTNLQHIAVGAIVNLECDIIGKYVVRALEIGDYRSLPARSDPDEKSHG